MTGTARVHVTVESTGRVASVVVSGHGFAGRPEGSCIARAVRGTAFTPFAGEHLGVTYPYRL
jgi:hypothetical protein